MRKWQRCSEIAVVLSVGGCGVEPEPGQWADGGGFGTHGDADSGAPDPIDPKPGGSAGGSDGTDDAAADDAADDAKFDVGTPGTDDPGCGPGGGEAAFSYIWIANSSEGTVSKIDTQTGVEQGRYWTHPGEGLGNPSRTSVNLLGDVAVSNRSPGGVMKIAAQPERCVDRNGNGTIETSHDSTPLPYAEEECRLWSIDLPTTQLQAGPRPTAWEGTKHPDSPCVYEEPRLWIGYKQAETSRGIFLRLDGTTGEVLDEIEGPEWGNGYGPYGGAVNGNGDLWVTGLGSSHAIHIDAETLEITNVGPAPGGSFYGMAVAANGDLWSAGGLTINHYDVAAGQWTTIGLTSNARGIQIDKKGTAWIALNGPCGLATVDTATDTLTHPHIALPGCATPVGISIDRDGFVWVVDRNANAAYKVDPDTFDLALTVGGLVSPYTYSDMTGAGLSLVVHPPG